MGIAHSYPSSAVIHADIDASTSQCLRSGLHQAVQMAGWAVDRVLSNGHVYVMTSLQDINIKCKVKIQDNGYNFFATALDVFFMDFEEEHVSQRYRLRYGPVGHRLRAHITPCQIFTYVPGSGDGWSLIMGGIPFLDPNVLAFTEDPCADDDSTIKTTRCWWSCSGLSTEDYVWGVSSFRDHWIAGCSAALHNNTFFSEAGYWIGGNARLRMFPLQRPTDFWAAYGNVNFAYPVILRWLGDEPLCLDPFIGWNDVHPAKIRGQLWDAFVRTKYVPWEDPLTFDGLEWFSYSCGERQGQPPDYHIYSTGDIFTLYLRDPGLTYFECKATNYAY
jgi:hypothetical protein